LEAPPISTNLHPPWMSYTRRRTHLHHQEMAKEEGVQGDSAPLQTAIVGASCAAANGTAPLGRLLRSGHQLPWGGTSSSSSTTPLHHPHCNILVNTMFDAIYYFPMMYYVECLVLSDYLFMAMVIYFF
jgi:hypothetical protein